MVQLSRDVLASAMRHINIFLLIVFFSLWKACGSTFWLDQGENKGHHASKYDKEATIKPIVFMCAVVVGRCIFK